MAMWTTETTDGVVVATYNNPPMNYFCAEGAQEFNKLIEEWRKPKYTAVIMTGAIPGKFITHYSVEELVDMASDREKMQALGTSLTSGYHGMLLRMRNLPKPVIVAMNGDTMGGGFELSLACDIRIGHAWGPSLWAAGSQAGHSARREWYPTAVAFDWGRPGG